VQILYENAEALFVIKGKASALLCLEKLPELVIEMLIIVDFYS
jgi:hypothetical protein